MASVFTYDPDPPRVSSPWLAPEDSQSMTQRSSPAPGQIQTQNGLLSDYGVTKLQAEPQSGPTEYKLHLLLRPRRAFKFMSTTPKPGCSPSSSAKALAATQVVSTQQTRQQRLKHLTTQLLWRLQQSSPYHASSSKELTIPKLPDDTADLDAPITPGLLIPGLEESRGALYEIGVSDDGTLVGLTKDEIDESIKTLRVMAASLGCLVEIVRTVIVGDCEWVESTELIDDASTTPLFVTRRGRLWVAEALVTPNLGLKDDYEAGTGSKGQASKREPGSGATSEMSESMAIPSRGSSKTPQLRVTLTGPTTSGKSSLLGTLSTGTLDNGRGKSRLSLLKHRHEMASGVTSSIAQELIGYKDNAILNFSQGNIESWVDIHDCSEGGRLVFLTDSGGHPRYRRTVLRGLLNWAPHWSILCIAADDGEQALSATGATSSARDVLGSAAAGVDLVKAHLTLALQLEVPMAIVITKMDLATNTSVGATLSKVLTAIKKAGRIPKIVQPNKMEQYQHDRIQAQDHDKIQDLVNNIAESESLTKYVPIVTTSAVKGTGIGLLHALLERLPLPPEPTAHDFVKALNPEQPKSLFHIDDTFNLPASYTSLVGGGERQGVVVSGHLRFGSLSVGDRIVVGPFQSDDEDSRGLAPDDRPSPGSFGLSISHPASAQLARIAMKNAISASTVVGEWHEAQVVSIRNLRLPVRTLGPGQAGSIGLAFERLLGGDADGGEPRIRVRRGMVLAVPSKHMLDTGLSLQAASGFTAAFDDAAIDSLAVGSFVNVYVASVRAAARVAGVSRHRGISRFGEVVNEDFDDIFGLNNDTEDGSTPSSSTVSGGGEVFLELLHNREWVELGSRVILLEGGSQDRSGLEGFAGRIVEIVD
ncbi:hypothetical protein B0I35DRAFT_347137 [Stachybotrys elegans]|uniref:Tr-type G domain-containing protein n=1 Tax=Stachybotrys elegans TaxID=80388 RepID=A0A8K0T0A7_9HYPO|nr:hypothetical protein B0I35DRAFT_347137 [Stachybotrys elegans]